MPNHLANETSPYLLQHKNNPVDWYPWGEEALARAKAEEKPVFLSIGYSACHWCHVMEHESFENAEIAKFLNEHFVCIKVDREERPDIDQIYMNAVQMLTGRGGWPMSVFLTPELKPFFGGTYWPPAPSRGMPGFNQVIAGVHDAWTNRRDKVDETADELTRRLDSISDSQGEAAALNLQLIQQAGEQLQQAFDPVQGGFGAAPKFPPSLDLGVLLRLWKRSGEEDGPQAAWLDMVKLTLDKMAGGGMYDQLGGGFHRYSVDEIWLVPHFEKMLYDNALLSGIYLDAFLATGDANYKRVVRETLDYVLREMTDATGAFYSTEDADSLPFDADSKPVGDHAEEGWFYTWTPAELTAVLGDAAAETFAKVYDVSEAGNFEGRSILNLKRPITQQAEVLGKDADELAKQLSESRTKLMEVRNKRPRPGLDDKVLTSWNGLMIESMARAGAALGEPRYLAAAEKAASFLLEEMQGEDDRLLHSWRHGEAKLTGYLDDYTALANGLVSLYEATLASEPNEKWLDDAASLLDVVLDKFADEKRGGFFYTAADHEELITRNRDLTDNATPGGNSLAATALLRLGKLTGRADYLQAAHETLKAGSTMMERAPRAMGQMLAALDLQIGPTHELVLVGDSDGSVARTIHKQFLPQSVMASRVAGGEGNRSPLLDGAFLGKEAQEDKPTLFVCQDHACQEPVAGEEAISDAVGKL